MNPLTDTLEPRIAFTTTAPFSINPNGSLIVDGSDGDDAIHVTATAGTITVSINALRGFTFATADVQRILIYGDAGDDRIQYAGAVQVPVVINGGFGRDRIHGSGPRLTMLGDAGNDVLVAEGTFGVTLEGNNGNDRLYGSTGADTFIGGRGNDYASLVRLGESHDGIETLRASS